MQMVYRLANSLKGIVLFEIVVNVLQCEIAQLGLNGSKDSIQSVTFAQIVRGDVGCVPWVTLMFFWMYPSILENALWVKPWHDILVCTEHWEV